MSKTTLLHRIKHKHYKLSTLEPRKRKPLKRRMEDEQEDLRSTLSRMRPYIPIIRDILTLKSSTERDTKRRRVIRRWLTSIDVDTSLLPRDETKQLREKFKELNFSWNEKFKFSEARTNLHEKSTLKILESLFVGEIYTSVWIAGQQFDFFIPNIRTKKGAIGIALEADGCCHMIPSKAIKDDEKEDHLYHLGITVIRNSKFENSRATFIRAVEEICKIGKPPSRSLRRLFRKILIQNLAYILASPSSSPQDMELFESILGVPPETVRRLKAMLEDLGLGGSGDNEAPILCPRLNPPTT